MEPAGDYGDQDLSSALDSASSSGRAVPLVVFGHMHQALHYRYGKGRRNMVQIDSATGEGFPPSCAPRIDLPAASRSDAGSSRPCRHCLLELCGGPAGEI